RGTRSRLAVRPLRGRQDQLDLHAEEQRRDGGGLRLGEHDAHWLISTQAAKHRVATSVSTDDRHGDTRRRVQIETLADAAEPFMSQPDLLHVTLRLSRRS